MFFFKKNINHTYSHISNSKKSEDKCIFCIDIIFVNHAVQKKNIKLNTKITAFSSFAQKLKKMNEKYNEIFPNTFENV